MDNFVRNFLLAVINFNKKVILYSVGGLTGVANELDVMENLLGAIKHIKKLNFILMIKKE
ncbi:MAG: hypothetical protein ACYDG2_14525 [Ruminiclostridium sp.]